MHRDTKCIHQLVAFNFLFNSGWYLFFWFELLVVLRSIAQSQVRLSYCVLDGVAFWYVSMWTMRFFLFFFQHQRAWIGQASGTENEGSLSGIWRKESAKTEGWESKLEAVTAETDVEERLDEITRESNEPASPSLQYKEIALLMNVWFCACVCVCVWFYYFSLFWFICLSVRKGLYSCSCYARCSQVLAMLTVLYVFLTFECKHCKMDWLSVFCSQVQN